MLARRVSAEGRTRAYLGGRSATAARSARRGRGAAVVLRPARAPQADAGLGPARDPGRLRGAGAGRRAARPTARPIAASGRSRARLEELRERAGARDRELDLLEWELAEIDRAAPSEEEERALEAERGRLRHVEALRGGRGRRRGRARTATRTAAAPRWRSPRRRRRWRRRGGVDAELDALAARVRALALEAEDLLHELHRYAEGVEAAPGRLDEVEERLALLDRLKRKHGGTIAAVLAHAEACRDAPRRAGRRRGGDRGGRGGAGRGPRRARRARRRAAPTAPRARPAAALAEAVRERLGALAMEGAEFTRRRSRRATTASARRGADEVEFLIAPNPGVPAGPLREIASGGELSRVMLALMGVAAEAGPGDAGLRRGRRRHRRRRPRAPSASSCARSPRAARSSASRTCRRSRRWPTATSRSSRTRRARPHARPSPSSRKADVVGELVRMLGADREDAAARRHAKELLKAA